MIIQIAYHAIISLGRWTKVSILHPDIIKDTKIRIIQLRFIHFFFEYIHRIKVAIAKDIPTTEWSEGKELAGRISCNNVSSISTLLKAFIGLSFIKKHCTQMLTKTAIKVEKKMYKAHCFSSIFLFMIAYKYNQTKKAGYIKTKISAQIGANLFIQSYFSWISIHFCKISNPRCGSISWILCISVK